MSMARFTVPVLHMMLEYHMTTDTSGTPTLVAVGCVLS
jgi:hypothetical protein